MRFHDSMVRSLSLLLALCSLVLIPACSGDDLTDGSVGMFRVSLTDAPTDELSKVVVALRSVTVTGPGGVTHRVAAGVGEVDLLELRDTARVLGTVGLPPGTYTSIAMTYDPAHSWVETRDGTRLFLATPLADITIEGPFEVRGRVTTDVLLDFDVDRSLFEIAADDWLLDPVVLVKQITVNGGR